jgi:cell division protein FtsB
MLTAFAVFALALAVVLLFWVAAKRRRTEGNLKQNIADLTVSTFKLRQERDELAAANKELQKAIAGLSSKQAEIMENVKSQ